MLYNDKKLLMICIILGRKIGNITTCCKLFCGCYPVCMNGVSSSLHPTSKTSSVHACRQYLLAMIRARWNILVHQRGNKSPPETKNSNHSPTLIFFTHHNKLYAWYNFLLFSSITAYLLLTKSYDFQAMQHLKC